MSPIRASALALLLIVFAIPGHSQESSGIPVHLKPDAKSPLIGSLETLALAVNTQWPDDLKPASGWQPIYFQGTFTVYINNDHISKDLSPKPGSPYLLSMEPEAAQLALATQSDKTDILEVNANQCQLSLETIVLAFIRVPDTETQNAQKISSGT